MHFLLFISVFFFLPEDFHTFETKDGGNETDFLKHKYLSFSFYFYLHGAYLTFSNATVIKGVLCSWQWTSLSPDQVYEFQSLGSHLSQESQSVTLLERASVSHSAFPFVKIMPSVVSQAVTRVSHAQKDVCGGLP